MRILLISSFFPPLNNIASSRIASFEYYLKKCGHEVYVITQHYDQDALNGSNLLVSFENSTELNNPYIRKGNVLYVRMENNSWSKKIFNFLPRGLKGLWAHYFIDVYHYGWLKNVLLSFKHEFSYLKFDCIIGSFGPATAFQASAIISEKYHIPWFADFRDLYIDFEVDKLTMIIKRYNQKRMLESSSGIFFVSPGMHDFFYKNYSGKSIPNSIVYNGFDDENICDDFDHSDVDVVNEFIRVKAKYDIILLHSGSLYKGRNLDFFIECVEKINLENEINVGVVLIGLSKNNFEQRLNSDCVVLPRVSVKTSFYLQKQCNALLMPIYHNLYTGFSGKVMEYLYSDNFILVEPTKHHDLLTFLRDFPNAKICSNFDDVHFFIKQIFFKKIEPVEHKKEKLTRSSAVSQMEKFISLQLKK